MTSRARTGRTTVGGAAVVAALALAISGLSVPAMSAPQARGTVDTVDPVPACCLATAREQQSATLLGDGRVLIAGGDDLAVDLSSAELFDSSSQTWSPTGSMSTPRRGHTATLLNDGRVLVVGGAGATAPASAELYDPTTGEWSPAATLGQARSGQTATLLPDGKVLVTGGSGAGDPVASAEVYDPSADTWTPTPGEMSRPRSSQVAALLSTGKVLVAGGYTASGVKTATAELYDPSTGKFAPTGSMLKPRAGHTAVPLIDGGLVLVAGGVPEFSNPKWQAERYDATTGRWTSTGPVAGHTRVSPTLVGVGGGKVLMTGGFRLAKRDNISTVEIYDRRTDAWTLEPTYWSWGLSSATHLGGGKVLLAGGRRQYREDIDPPEVTATAAVLDAPATPPNLDVAVGISEPYDVGDRVGYDVTATNLGEQDTTSWVRVSPPSGTRLEVQDVNCIEDSSAPDYTCYVRDLAPGETRHVVTATVRTTLLGRVTAHIGEGAFDDPSNNTATSPTWIFRPDAVLRPEGAAPVGDGVYGDGAVQRLAVTVPRGGQRTVSLGVQNDALAATRFMIGGMAGSARILATYLQAQRDVTSAVTGSGLTSGRLVRGAELPLRLVVRPVSGAVVGSSRVFTIKVTGKPDPETGAASTDEVRVVVTVGA